MEQQRRGEGGHEKKERRDEELAGFIGLGLINSYGEVNINLDSNSVTCEQSRSPPIAATFFLSLALSFLLLPPSLHPFCVGIEITDPSPDRPRGS